MKRPVLFLAIPLLLLIVAACSSAPAQNQPVANSIPQTEDDVPRITVRDAKAALDSGAAILVDVRSAEAYAERRAAGAVSIPLINFENNVGSLSLEKDQWIITYCT